ncbi:MAG: acyltransferase domain-containing protein [Treponemataceae bacterium]|nr:acyltransferase domain-containing protein [Treponemataceae bacterium]
MTVEELCSLTGMPDLVSGAMIGFDREPLTENLRFLAEDLIVPGKAEAAQQEIHQMFCGRGDDGYYILFLHLKAACLAYESYRKRGIADSVYAATMECFARFVKEHYASFGRYGFDRDFWTWRQLSLCLFRLGTLEYEFASADRTVFLHIPGNADITRSVCAASFAEFRSFCRDQFPECIEWPCKVESWLVAPALDQLLPENSRIRQFKSCFETVEVNEDADDYKTWVFGSQIEDMSKAPEETSLQRKIKEWVLKGGKIGEAKAVLCGF